MYLRVVPGGAGRDRTDDLKLAKLPLSQLSYGPFGDDPPPVGRVCAADGKVVGPGRLELPTSRLSGVRSNHLSYGPSGSRQRAGILMLNRTSSARSMTLPGSAPATGERQRRTAVLTRE
jgi:hypothetical protein